MISEKEYLSLLYIYLMISSKARHVSIFFLELLCLKKQTIKQWTIGCVLPILMSRLGMEVTETLTHYKLWGRKLPVKEGVVFEIFFWSRVSLQVQYHVVVKSLSSGAGLKPGIHYLQAVCTWASYLTSLASVASFVKWGVITLPSP